MRPTRCHGFALPTLLVMLALASVATLLALRNLWVNEQLLNADADQLRTQHAAEAVLPIALADIVGTASTNTTDTTPNLRHTVGSATQTHAFFPNTLADYSVLRLRLAANTCNAGICAPSDVSTPNTPTPNQASYWKAQIASAQPVSAAHSPYGDNTAWYWVEVFPQANTDTFVYRITALANGVMPGSTTVLQAIWARTSAASSTGQWRSWHVLHN